MRFSVFGLTHALLLLWCLPLFAQPNDDAAIGTAVGEALKGGWVVAYEDRSLGWVRGRAFLDPEFNSAEITFRHPQTNAEIQLRARSFRIDGGEVEIVLPPGSPSAIDSLALLGAEVDVARPNVMLSLGESIQQVALGSAVPPDGSVTLKLRYDRQADQLAGYWVQPVDPNTGETPDGKGRVGLYRFGEMSKGDADMVGTEVWARPPPVLKGAFSIRDQTGATLQGPRLPYPYPGGRSTPNNLHNTLRDVMVVGRFLPQRYGDRLNINSLDDKIEYYVYRLKSDYAQSLPDTWLRDTGFTRLREMQKTPNPPYTWDPAKEDFMILRANLKPGVLPGRKTIEINGQRVEWLLRFGDHTAKINFTRDSTQDLRDRTDINQSTIPIETDPAVYVYSPEQVFIEVSTAPTFPIDQLPIVVALNDKILKFDGKRELLIRRSPNPDERHIFRSPPIYLVREGEAARYQSSALTIKVKRKDRLQSYVVGEPVLDLSATPAQVMVLNEPSEIRGAMTGDWSRKSLTWPQAVFIAAQCADLDGLTPTTDVNSISRAEADSYSNSVPTSLLVGGPAILTTRVKVGEHAGMIMLRQMIADLLREKLPLYENPLSNKDILGLRATLRNAVKYGDAALEKVKVKQPDGSAGNLEISFFPALLEERYGLTGERRTAYQIAAMREARIELAASLRESIERVEAEDACDVDDMALMTGFGFESVAARVRDALMKRKGVIEQNAEGGAALRRTVWVPDRQARARVENVGLIAQTLREQRGFSSAEWTKFNAAVSVATFGIGLTTVQPLLIAALAIDVTGFGVALHQEVSQQIAESQEVAFARGAATIIGTRRINLAVERDKPWYASVGKVAFAGLQVAGSAYAVYSVRFSAQSAAQGETTIAEITPRLPEEGVAAVRRLPRANREDIVNAVVRARRLEENIGRAAMETQELEALEFSRLIESGELSGNASTVVRNKPWWAREIDDATFLKLDDMIHRDDVIRLFARHRAEMTGLLQNPHAVNILRLPQDDLASFAKAVQRASNRAPARGRAFVDQADAANGDPEGIFFGDIQMSRGTDGLFAELRAYHGVDQQSPVAGLFVRGRAPDDAFGTGKDLFVFDTAQPFRTHPPAPKPPDQPGYYAGPRWVHDVRLPLRDNAPGVPFVMYSNMRTYKALGFEYADPNLAGIKLSNIQSANTAGQLHWLRHAYPEKSVNELFKYTTSYRYAENTAQQLGFKITDVEVRGAVPGQTQEWVVTQPLRMAVESRWFDPGVTRTAADVAAAREAFIKKFSVDGAPQVPIGFDAFLKFEPIN